MILETAPDITVTAEASDEEAIRLVSKSRPDVVLMDVRMPGTDGIDATRRLATMAPECRIAIHHLRARRVRLRGSSRRCLGFPPQADPAG